MSKFKHFETLAIRTQVKKSAQKEHSVPIFATSSFTFDNAEEARAVFAEEQDGNIYSRYNNPSTDEFVNKMCLLEGAEVGLATASGMAAIYTTLMGLLRSGDHILASKSLFGSTYMLIKQLLPRWNIDYTLVDIKDNKAWEQGIQKNTKVILAETPSNPGLDLCDLEFLGKLSKANNITYVVDNCFATPYIQTPIQFGADIVCHSATKFIDGQGRAIGGVIVGSERIMPDIRMLARQTGPSMSPFNGWILSKSLETLGVRLDRHCSNATKLAEFLSSHKAINWVKYPFMKNHPQYRLAQKQMRLGGGLVCFEVKGDANGAQTFVNNLEMLSITSNLGDSRTIATHPATTTHSKLTEEQRLEAGITQGTMRVSVGLENIEDIIKDIDSALSKV
jgi:O-succinylhomoserine sulfhydrylase